MARQIQLSGTRSPLLWLLMMLLLILLGVGLIALVVWLPQRQVEQQYQAGVAFQNVEAWDRAGDAFMAVIELDATYKDVQARLAAVRTRQAETQVGVPSAPLSTTPVAIPAATLLPPTAPPLPLTEVDGDWEFDIQVYRNRASDASTSVVNEHFTIAIRLDQENNRISGRYLDASGNACDNAGINGERQDDIVQWTIRYTGLCCNGAQMTFRGQL